ncbi:RhoGAP domain-containing protein [Spironucleus salmonicida]|uniref:RhoGAP domain-containing protein n=1 Tax=Spironucleus salmonicida TaxID=348837 RepID=V6LNK3_9EUKA|nr:RhoGAP domain-containing protein [Spironucleus salmonicida]|eukprot:EST46252.1 RhoGAP domain-containing protein [Spironucleus salmonicida]
MSDQKPENEFANKTKDFFSKFSKSTKDGFQKFGEQTKQTFQEVGQKVKESKIDEKFKDFGNDLKTKTTTLFKPKNSEKLFGIDLKVLLNAENCSVPIFIQNAQKIIQQRAKTIGIFRTSPDFGSLQAAIKSLEANHGLSLESMPTEVICSLIKQFLRQLEVKVLDETIVKEISLSKNSEFVVQKLVENVDLERFILLIFVLQILECVNLESSVNMMNANNLAIIFAPNLLAEEVGGNFQYIETVEWLICNYGEIKSVMAKMEFVVNPEQVLSDYKWGKK